jgi:sulfofructose kinase
MPGGSIEARLQRVLSYGPRHAGVTLGAQGYHWADRDGGGRCSGFPVDVVDTTGAGDVFHGAFTLAMVEGVPMDRCAAIACAAAALKCTRLGSRAGLPNRVELEAFLAERI